MKTTKDFAEKVRVAPNGCWVWIGAKTSRGYGCVSYRSEGKKKQLAAHRLSYALHKGSFDKQNHVLHKCDNTLCVNPEHLFLGTQQDNMKDMSVKNRGRKGLLTKYITEGKTYKEYKRDWARTKRKSLV